MSNYSFFITANKEKKISEVFKLPIQVKVFRGQPICCCWGCWLSCAPLWMVYKKAFGPDRLVIYLWVNYKISEPVEIIRHYISASHNKTYCFLIYWTSIKSYCKLRIASSTQHELIIGIFHAKFNIFFLSCPFSASLLGPIFPLCEAIVVSFLCHLFSLFAYPLFHG